MFHSCVLPRKKGAQHHTEIAPPMRLINEISGSQNLPVSLHSYIKAKREENMDSRRQQKVASLIKEEFSEILLREGRGIYGKAFVTVTQVKVTPDLAVVRFSLSVFNGDKDEVIQRFQDKKQELKRKLGEKLRFNLRIVPELEFYLDETLDDVFRMEELFKKIKEDDKGIKS